MNPGPAVGVLDRRERSTGARTWYCHVKQNEALREGRRESHPFIVPLKQGNLDRGDPGEERGRSVVDSCAGHPLGALYPKSGSP